MKKKLSIEIEQEASYEIDIAYEWYENQLLGLGDEFKEELNNSFKVIQNSVDGFEIFGKHHQFPMKRFPYVILYEATKSILYIDAVFHTRRNPEDKER